MKALIVYGGWTGHDPVKCAKVFARELKKNGFDVETSDSLDAFADAKKLKKLDLLVPHWTMGELPGEAWAGISEAVRSGVGIAGCHGGMGDAFRVHTGFQMMVGGQFVDHPLGGIEYRVDIVDHADPIVADLESFHVTSEQYYMHVDPSNHVLASTTFVVNGCTMPVVWKRMYGKGRVFYSSLGHAATEFKAFPNVLKIMTRGMLWAAKACCKPAAKKTRKK